MKENPKEQSMSEFDKYKKPTGCSYTFQPDGIDYCWGYAASVDSGAKMDCTGCEYLLPEPPKEKGMVSIDKVLECFDNANENTKKALLTSHQEIIDYCVNYIRKSLENIVNG